MELHITARNIDLDKSLKVYINKRFDKLPRIYSRIYRCDVVLDSEKERKNAEVIITFKRNKLVAKESSLDILSSVDMVADKIKRQLRRMNGRIRSKRRKNMMKRIMSPVSGFSWFDRKET